LKRGGRVVTDVACGMRWTCRCRRRSASMRTAKSCGPGLPTLRPSPWRYERRGRWEQESPVPRESTK